ncbi:MAG: hypothetical protein IKH26_05980 [Bacteroidaceae bacterium]|nr:hypothetical protein [Bacteroidaceae bacterium]
MFLLCGTPNYALNHSAPEQRFRDLVPFRCTFFGHMMLGQGFLWIDLVAYLIGIAIITFSIPKNINHWNNGTS